MNNSINLLPADLRGGKEVAKKAQLLTRLTLAAGFLFFMLAIAFGALLIYLRYNVSDLVQDQESLKGNISNLESTEQKLVLVKDRLTKTAVVFEQRSEYEVLKKHQKIIEGLPAGATYLGSEIDEGISRLNLVAQDSTVLSQVIDSLQAQESQNLSIEVLVFNPIKGYELVVKIF